MLKHSVPAYNIAAFSFPMQVNEHHEDIILAPLFNLFICTFIQNYILDTKAKRSTWQVLTKLIRLS